MSLVPQSLFSRLVLVLLAGLSLMLLTSVLVLFQDRGKVLYQASGLHSAQRISAIVRLLESFEPDERARIVSVLSDPSLRVALTDTRPALATPPQGAPLAGLFGAMIERHLGTSRSYRVAVWEVAPMDVTPGHRRGLYGTGLGADMPMRRHAYRGSAGLLPRGGMAFQAQVQLRDGPWVSFEQYVPDEVFAWSMRLLVTLGVLLASVVVLSVVAVRWITHPLSVLSGAAEALGRDLRRPRLPERGPIEVRRAAHAFNTMQGRLLRYIEDRTRLLTALSHDLKTPITRLRLRAELLEDESLRDSILRDLDEMQAMTMATLRFLKGMEGDERVQPVDIHALLESLRADAEDMGYEVQIEGGEPAPYPARPLALKRCIGNLIDNAVKYGKRTSVSLSEQNGVLRIAVADAGPGIPEAQLEQVFEPFYRLEASRNRDTGGTGLGLSIARNIARAHGGNIRLRNRPEGGLEAVLTLPR
jgi:signal transduction histidine kinase